MKILKFLRDYLNGDFAYRHYLQHCEKTHAAEKPLSKKEFFAMRQKEKWNKVSRCC